LFRSCKVLDKPCSFSLRSCKKLTKLCSFRFDLSKFRNKLVSFASIEKIPYYRSFVSLRFDIVAIARKGAVGMGGAMEEIWSNRTYVALALCLACHLPVWCSDLTDVVTLGTRQ
jgi:hypothetical protein